jgi:hypothetical protein
MTSNTLPPNELFWGLTLKDFENSFWNSMYEVPTFFTGLAVAGVANVIGQMAFNNKKQSRGESPYPRLMGITTLATAAGVAASVYVGSSVSHVQFTFEKAIKFLVISCCFPPISPITYGGIAGYFGRTTLYITGLVGALTGGLGSAFIIKAFK